MTCNVCKMAAFAMAAVLAVSSSASAEIVASYAGPTDFNGTSTMVSLDGCSIGTEGTIQFDLKADKTDYGAGNGGVLWYLADGWGGTNGEYRVWVENNQIRAALWDKADSSAGGYAVQAGNGSLALTDTENWHTYRLTWKQGENTLITLDGGTAPGTSLSVSNARSLATFAATLNTLGAYPQPGQTYNYFDGSMRNVIISNAYNTVPEPATISLLATGLVGLLAYAWRKRR